MYNTKKERYPGGAVLDAEFAAVATPEQVALFESTMLLSAAGWTVGERDAYRGLWSLFDGRGNDVLWFHRSTGEVQVAS